MPLIVEVMNFLIRWKAFGRVEGIGVEMKKVTYSVQIFPAVQASQNGLSAVIFTLCLGLRNRGGEPGNDLLYFSGVGSGFLFRRHLPEV